MARASVITQTPARLAIYYGYPSLVNGANGDVEKATEVFSRYDVVVFGDGLEFSDHQASRIAQGDPTEHAKVTQIIAKMKQRNAAVRIYGYVPLGEYQHLSDTEIQQRIGLWKQMGVAGIFLDEGSYDFGNVDRARQNKAVNYVHQQGLSAFMNGFFPDHIFGLENEPLYSKGKNKNPSRQPPALNANDLYLIESYQIREGAYDDPANWQERMKKVLDYRKKYGTQMFAITTAGKQSFDAQKLNYGWWSAWMNDLDGFGWGEPNFSASDNLLPDHRCVMNATDLKKMGPVSSEKNRFWRKAGGEMVVLDTNAHTVKRVKPAGVKPAAEGATLMCGAK
ncbi:MAG TPA: hypothetical protein VH088_20090 [Terriglobales bacterium]|jgi:hypothetical protein|nr:hypothetical protein [Terriglobales bacterium]